MIALIWTYGSPIQVKELGDMAPKIPAAQINPK
jgi:hypothetical protein